MINATKAHHVLPAVRAILFDLDGVLADSSSSVVSHWETFASWYGLPPARLLAEMHGRRADDLMRDYLDPELVPEAYERFVALEANDCNGTRALPGARQLLAALAPSEWAVVTSGARVVAEGRLRAASLPMPWLLVSADDVACGKPNPEGYLMAAAALSVPVSACLVVEDSPTGMRAGRAAGCSVLGLVTTHAPEQVMRLCDALAQDLGAVAVERGGRGIELTVNGARHHAP